MKRAWRRFKKYLRSLFAPVPWPHLPAPAPEAIPPASFTLRGSILEELEYYFDVLRRLRRSDPDAFAALSRTGIWLLPQEPEICSLVMTPWWKHNRPAFGAIAFATHPDRRKDEDKRDKTHPRFIYFTRYASRLAPPDIERTNYPDIYVVTCYWTSEGDKRFEVPTSYAIALAEDGDIRILRQRLKDHHTISYRGRSTGFSNKGKYKTTTVRDSFTIPRQRWGLPNFYSHWASENKIPAATMLQHVFAIGATAFEHAQLGMAQVRVGKGALTAVFNIEIKRTAYFFRDREAVVIDGKTKRIFHIVRPHDRIGARSVRFHFRGLREFVWHGYQVSISVPGLHHLPITDLQEGMADGEMLGEAAAGWADMKTLGDTVREVMTLKLPNKQSWLRQRIEPEGE